MYKPEPPTFNKSKQRCENCPEVAVYESMTITREKHCNCEVHWRQLLNRVQVVSWKRI